MKSVFLDKKHIHNNVAKITNKSDINHLKNVLRMVDGDILRIVDGKYEYLGKMSYTKEHTIEVQIYEINKDKHDLKIQIDVALGILKNEKMDLVIQKLTELGINGIIPIITERVIARLTEKKDKWDKIIKETLKQCQGIRVTNIDVPKKLLELEYSNYDIVIVPYEEEEHTKLRDILKDKANVKRILYLIGPEGGFANHEITFLKSKNCKVITLGPRILRAETAAIVMGGILINEFI